MTSKCFRQTAATASVLWVLLALGAYPLFAQIHPPPATRSGKPMGHLRVWNMQPIGSPLLELLVADGLSPEGRMLLTAAASSLFGDYLALPPGMYPLKIYRADARENPVKSFNFPLRNDTWYTILASQAPGGPLTFEVIDDTPDPTQAPVNRLTVRQFCPNVRVQVSAGQLQTAPLSNGGSQTLEGLPDGAASLTGEITLASGMVRNLNIQLDFRGSHHATLLLVGDRSGLVRPRVTIDGPDEVAAGTTNAEPVKGASKLGH